MNKVVISMFLFKLKVVIVSVLVEEGYVESFKVVEGLKFELEIILKYF